jgi:CheY-like chemotaxis protein
MNTRTTSDADATGSVLVVEDNETTRGRIARVLRTEGYEVTEAVDGLDALQKVSARPFDAILLDLVLPHVDGWQFRATQLRHPELATIPTVIVTVQPLRQPDRYALRAMDIVHKPFEDAVLMQAVQRACRVRQPPPSPVNREVGGLFWSRRGEVACATHAPDAGSAQWREEGWAPMVRNGSNTRVFYQCQHCPGHESAIDRSRRRPGPQGSTPATRRGAETAD